MTTAPTAQDEAAARETGMTPQAITGIRGGAVLLHHSRERADLFTWQDEMFKEYGASNTLVDTWEVEDNGAPLYICTIVLLVPCDYADARRAEWERCAQVAEQPLGPGLSGRDDYWQPAIAAAIRALD